VAHRRIGADVADELQLQGLFTAVVVDEAIHHLLQLPTDRVSFAGIVDLVDGKLDHAALLR